VKDLRDYTFIDFGSGKGRALLMAADLQFKSLIGIELRKELHDKALQISITVAKFVRAGSKA
jgi:tRNA1(Val) A37 N6-methylase TrmN6